MFIVVFGNAHINSASGVTINTIRCRRIRIIGVRAFSLDSRRYSFILSFYISFLSQLIVFSGDSRQLVFKVLVFIIKRVYGFIVIIFLFEIPSLQFLVKCPISSSFRRKSSFLWRFLWFLWSETGIDYQSRALFQTIWYADTLAFQDRGSRCVGLAYLFLLRFVIRNGYCFSDCFDASVPFIIDWC